MTDPARVLPFPPSNLANWKMQGRELGDRERAARSLMWEIGDWWIAGEAYGDRVDIVTADDWKGQGPSYQTCRIAGSVAGKFADVFRRRNTLSFYHHAVVAALPPEEADRLLDWCEETISETGEPRSVMELRAEVKRLRRSEKLRLLANAPMLSGKFNVIYADPPWRFEPFSRVSGLDRAADNHYPTMTLDAIKALPIPAADDCVLFLWATVPMLPQALEVMVAWGFAYKSHCVWIKDSIGTGYWFRNLHELLLVGTRGEIPAPAPGEQYDSVLQLAAGAHSAKPAGFAEIIEEMFQGLPAVELFARAPRLGWDVWGNET
jgi:N6-adenosine-specific RNA methylase IME4